MHGFQMNLTVETGNEGMIDTRSEKQSSGGRCVVKELCQQQQSRDSAQLFLCTVGLAKLDRGSRWRSSLVPVIQRVGATNIQSQTRGRPCQFHRSEALGSFAMLPMRSKGET